jgi:perosamine synthetase
VNIPITKPYLGAEELEALREPLSSGWLTQGPQVRRFEDAFAETVGAPYAVSCTSCTSALHLALTGLGIGPGDEVILPSFTFVASANAIEYTRARPVFVDIQLDTFNIDPVGTRAAITARTKAIMPVHLFGLAADMTPLLAMAREHGLKVIEDAACGAGSRAAGKALGTIGDAGCYSFHPRKVITTGEGGMVVTHDRALAERLTQLRSHGAAVSDLDRHKSGGFVLPSYDRIGFNYRMSDLQAAVGLVQLGRLDWIVAERRRRARRYTDAFSRLAGITCPIERAGYFHAYQSYVLFVDTPLSRDDLASRLAAAGIATRQGTHAVHTLGVYASKYRFHPNDFPNALAADRQSLALPLYPQMTDDEQHYVIQHVLAAAGEC